MDVGVRALLDLLPDAFGRFEGTEWPMPVAWAFLAGPPDVERVRRALVEHAEDEIKKSIEPALLAAEVIEAAQADRQKTFITDNQARTSAFRGAKWRAGWVCLVGGGPQAELAKRFKQDRWLIFAAGPAGPDVDVPLGDRPTALISFAQLIVRYGFIYGLIPPGEDHELGHFLEADLPGVVVATAPLSPVEALLVLGLMYLGAPAVVPPSFPYDYGRRMIAETVDDIVDAASRFPNLRVRKTTEGQVALPEFCDPVHRSEPFQAARSWGGSPESWFCVRPGGGRMRSDPLMSFRWGLTPFSGPPDELPSMRPGEAGEGLVVEGEPGPDLGLLVEIGDPRANDLVTDWLERVAGGAPSYIQGVRADLRSAPRIDLAAGANPRPAQIAEAVRSVLRHQYPLLKDINVLLTFDREQIVRLRPEVEAFKSRRYAAVEALSDQTVSEVYSCIDCQTFAHGHVCFLTPGRPSMCSTRPFLSAMAAAYFGDVQEPWRRRAVAGRPHQQVVPLGRCLDPAKGEYEGLNRAAEDLSGGLVRRVFLHDLRDFPHTSCGCFWAIAFYIPEVDGVGIMTRDYTGRAPDGSTWMTLANRAGGKQAPGMAGIGRDYLASPDFLRGHGGLRSVVWASAKAAEALREVDPSLRFSISPSFPPPP
jgi:hypothetical protein